MPATLKRTSSSTASGRAATGKPGAARRPRPAAGAAGGTSRTTRLFRTGGSLAVRIPNAWATGKAGDAVRIRQNGQQIIVEPVDEWPEEFLARLGSLRGVDIPVRLRRRSGTRMRVYL